MTESTDERPSEGTDEPVVHCRRTGQDYDAGTHERCPYCFGQSSDVRPGAHGEFCDFDPDKDPVSFGFPPGTTRDREG